MTKMIRTLALPLVVSLLAITVLLLTVNAAPSSAVPTIMSDAPWHEENGNVVAAGEIVSYTFSADAGQVATIDLLIPDGSTLAGAVTLLKASDGQRVDDAVYGPAADSFGPGNSAGLTAVVPETGEYFIEIDAADGGDGATGAFTLRFNLIDSGSTQLVDDDLSDCPTAPTGFVRAAVRAAGVNGTVDVCTGHYTTTRMIRFGQAGLTLSGAGKSQTWIGSEDLHTLYLEATDLNILDLGLRGSTKSMVGAPLTVGPDRLTIENCRMEGTVHAVYIGANVPTSDVTVRNCEIQLEEITCCGINALLVRGDRTHIHDNLINTRSGDDHTYSRYGIFLTGDDAHVHDNQVGQSQGTPNTEWSIRVRGDNARIEDNKVSGYRIGIYVSADQGVSSTAIIRQNQLYGTNVGGTPSGIIASTIDRAEVRSNFISDYPGLSYGINLSSSGGRVVNNRVTVSGTLGALNYLDSFDLAPPVTFVNNTVVHGAPRSSARGLYIHSGAGTVTTTLPVTVTNNLFSAPQSPPWARYPSYCGITSDRPLKMVNYNLVAGYELAYCDAVVAGSNNVRRYWPGGNLADSELHLKETSPAVDAGTSTGAPDFDFEGEPRPANAGVDIGADEVAVPSDLAVETTGPLCTVGGMDTHFDVLVQNKGPRIANNVVVTATLPADSDSINGFFDGRSCTVAGNQVTCSLGDMNVRERISVRIVARLWDTDTPSDTAIRVGNGLPDVDPSDNEVVDSRFLQWSDPDEPDLEVRALELTQGVQNLNNDMPLIYNRTTWARAYVCSLGPDTAATARLHAYRNGEELHNSPITPVNDKDVIVVRHDGGDRTDFDDSFQFYLPYGWRGGDTTFEVEVEPVAGIEEIDTSNNRLRRDVSFHSGETRLQVKLLPVKLFECGDPDSDPLTWWADEPGTDNIWTLSDIMSFAQGLLPVVEIERTFMRHPASIQHRALTKPFNMCEEDGQERLLKRLRRWRFNHFRWGDLYVVGMVHPNVNTPGASGMAYRDTHVAWVKMSDGSSNKFPWKHSGGATMAHELGHNLGLKHVPCSGGEENIVNDYPYPYPDCRLAEYDTAGYYGFEPAAHDAGLTYRDGFEGVPAIISNDPTAEAPHRGYPFMGYKGPEWASPYEYCRLLDINGVPCDIGALEGQTAAQPEIARTDVAAESHLLISGAITPTTETATIDTVAVYRDLPAGTVDQYLSQAPSDAPYAVVQRDAEGNILTSTPISPTPPVAAGSPINMILFFELVPHADGAASVELHQDGNSIASVTASASPPTVMLQTPNGGETLAPGATVTWTANDPDGDQLLFDVLYSPDGGNRWEVVALDLIGTSYTLDTLENLSGSEMGRFRVVARDGFHTAQDESDGTFQVPGAPPEVFIQTPQDGVTVTQGSLVVFTGFALDKDEIRIADEGFSWTSDQDGTLGTGRELALPTLSQGTHQVTLAVTDSAGETTSTHITIHVEPGEATPEHTIYLPLQMRAGK